MLRFNKLYQKLMEDIAAAAPVPGTTGQALGPTQAQPAQIGKSGDFYAPGDYRMPKVLGAKKKKKTKKESAPIIRRTFPGM